MSVLLCQINSRTAWNQKTKFKAFLDSIDRLRAFLKDSDKVIALLATSIIMGSVSVR